MVGNQYHDLEQFRSQVTKPQTRKNAFLWLMPFILVFAGWNVLNNFSDYGFMQTVRGVEFQSIKAGLERYSLPIEFKDALASVATDADYNALFKQTAQKMKFYIGFYMAIAIISLGLFWKDIISILGTASFLLIVCVYKLWGGIIPYADFSLFFVLMLMTLKMEEGNKN